jgi:hypothetical protein
MHALIMALISVTSTVCTVLKFTYVYVTSMEKSQFKFKNISVLILNPLVLTVSAMTMP